MTLSQTCPEDRPLAVQFAACDAATLVRAAKMVAEHCDVVDINLCWPQVKAEKGAPCRPCADPCADPCARNVRRDRNPLTQHRDQHPLTQHPELFRYCLRLPQIAPLLH